MLNRLLSLALMALMLSAPMVQAADVAGNQSPNAAAKAKAANQVDAQKLTLAKDLTQWLQTTLTDKKALVAVVARKGGPDAKKHDATGMAHSGIAVYDPRAKTWIIYNLLNEGGSPPKASLWRTAPLDFFYGQTGYDKDALVMIPDTVTQQRMYEAVLNGNYQKLQFTPTYNLLSRFDSPSSLNCNKWILMNLAAARQDNYQPKAVLQAIREGYKPGQIKLNPIEKAVVRKKANVVASELPASGPIETVTVESLYKSTMFTDKVFYSGKTSL
jgi:hypothetical protein